MLVRICLLILILVLGSSDFLAQGDSVQYTPEFVINDGVFLSHDDMRKNKSISKDQIQSQINKEQLDFLTKVVEAETIEFSVNGSTQRVSKKDVWGYVQNGTFYVNYKSKFYRVPVFGAISFLVAVVEVQNTGFYDPRFGGYTGTTISNENREFIMNFYDGKLVELQKEEVETLLRRDKALFAEYSKLSQRQQKEQLYRFIRKYNSSNPVYFLQN